MDNRSAVLLGCCALLLGLAACGSSEQSSASAGVRQTHFPGEITAGGGTSGEVLARAGNAPTAQNASGTPGIPQGKEGNTGGTEMGGASPGAAASKAAGQDEKK